MGVADPIRVVHDTVGSKGDPDVLDYIVRSLEDGDFDYGEDGQEAIDAFGEMLVSYTEHLQSCCLLVAAVETLPGMHPCVLRTHIVVMHWFDIIQTSTASASWVYCCILKRHKLSLSKHGNALRQC